MAAPATVSAQRTQVPDHAVTAGPAFLAPRIIVACELSESIPDAFRAVGLDARQIEGFPDYAVTSCGNIFSRKHVSGPRRCFKQIRPCLNHKGYRGLTLANSTGDYTKRVHRLVASAFHPNPDNLPCVRHKSGIPGDNRAVNLAWSTYVENAADKKTHGTWVLCVTNKMTVADRALARSLVAEGLSFTAVGKKIGVSGGTVSDLIRGITWKGE